MSGGFIIFFGWIMGWRGYEPRWLGLGVLLLAAGLSLGTPQGLSLFTTAVIVVGAGALLGYGPGRLARAWLGGADKYRLGPPTLT